MTPTVVFDVNETLLDLAPVRVWFHDHFDDRPSAAEWFSELLRLSFVSSVINIYTPFTELAANALTSVADKYRVAVSSHDLTTVSHLLTRLPPHRDSAPGIELLKNAGFSVAALTNSPLTTAQAQLEHAELAPLFDAIMSVEMVERFKPHRSVYLAAAAQLSVEPSFLVMVAAHDWDVAGAMASGCQGVFIARDGRSYSEAFPDPTFVAPDIETAATRIVGASQP
ncbi:MAG: haloacid dehalogenase type II [Armatimonadetes bacterium]|nr:MAG: haloacid dehalogenase type II [Armatimonadota bacterium]